MAPAARALVATSAAGLALALSGTDGGGGAPSVPRIVYAANAQSATGQNREVFSVRIDGKDPGRLTRNGGWDWTPRLASDGRRVVVSRTEDWDDFAQATTSIVLIDRDRERALVPGHHLEGLAEYPRWSPNGRWVAFQLPRASGSGGRITSGPTDIWVVRPNGTERRRLLDAGALNHAGVLAPEDHAWDWSPDSRSIAYQRELPEDRSLTELAVVDVETGVVRRLTAGWHPDWAPRGRLVAAVDDAGIFVVDASTTARRRIARNGKTSFDVPVWSPDARRIAFYAGDPTFGTSTTFLYVVNSDGSQRRRLASIAWSTDRPCWTDDGKTLVYNDGHWIYRVAASGRAGPVRLIRGVEPDCGA